MKIGDSISRYRLVKELGKGGMGVVFQAEDTRLNRPVALKFLPGTGWTEQDRQRFLNEARAAAQVRHQNICPIYDIEEADGQIFISMAALDGETLHRHLAAGALPPAAAADIAAQIAEGLAKAHETGIIHRDIKSSNIMVGSSGHVSIMDFGLALREGDSRLTEAGNTVGTPAYMAPEQARGLPVDARSDIWSLGVLLFEMLTGTLPFRRQHTAAILHGILYDPVVWPDLPAVADDLRRIVERALEKDPDRRYQSATEMAADLRCRTGTQQRTALEPSELRSYSRSESSDVTRTMAIPKATDRLPRTRRALLGTAAIALLVIGGGIAARWRPWSAPAAPAETERQVAVLPFTVIGTDENARIVADGLVEIVTAALTDAERFHGRITAVPSSEIRARSINSAADARRIYGVDLAITGSVQLGAGGRLQFMLALVDTAKLRQLAVRAFEYDPQNPLAARDRAVQQLASLLNFTVTPAVQDAVATGDSTAPGAYGAYVSGRGLLVRYDQPGNIDRAIASFSEAARLDPKFALAYAGLAEAYWRRTRQNGDHAMADKALSNARRAVELDGRLAPARAILGQVYGTVGMEHEAVVELQQAMQLAPGDAQAPRELARVYANLGRFGEAEDLYRKATQSRPSDWYGHLLLGGFLLQQERYSEAEQSIRKARDLTPDNDIPYRYLGSLYTNQGRYGEAVAALEKAIALNHAVVNYQILGGAYIYQHRYSDAVHVLEEAVAIDATRVSLWGNLGIAYKWNPGTSKKSEAALRRGMGIATKFLETSPNDYNIRAELAEFRARLGDAKGAVEEIDRIPEASRRGLANRLVLAYELSHRRSEAIDLIRDHLANPATVNMLRDDPDLAALWADPDLQKAIPTATRK